MATLVLTAVGTAIGGPVGGAIGALIGQGIDQRLFRAPAKDGPRLSTLAVQTSSYGTPVPQLFGTMRVAGTIIWASDLIETRAAAGGKGGGSNRFSYAASLAVLLSGRPIRAVRRIWAEGALIRGAAGDWKVQTGFRLHTGGEDQEPDPLIASAEAATPAYRGMAYAVFEGLQLEPFGQRIPSLTFEVEADAAPIGSGAVAAALCPEVIADGGVALAGFAATGSARGVLETLATIDGEVWRADGGRIVRVARDGAARAVDDPGYAAEVPVGVGRRSVAPIEAVPRSVAVAHHDPARDYQIGVQRVRRAGAGLREDRVDLPAVLDAAAAKGVAAAMLAQAEARRTRRQVALGPEAIDIAPGGLITRDAARWRVTSVAIEGLATTLTLEPLAAAPAARSASSGRALVAPDRLVGRTLLVAAELPGLEDLPAAAPRLIVCAAGEGAGWRGAGLLYSLDDGASWTVADGSAAPAVLGTVEVAPAAAEPGLRDERSRAVVRLARADMALADADTRGIAAGSNLALVGEELLQFGRAEPLGSGRWALSDLRRGLRGSEAAIGGQAVGDRFVLLEPDAMRSIVLPLDAIGRTVRVMASGIGDLDGPVETAVTVTGASVAPPAPVRLTLDGADMLRWVRRSRSGWTWTDGLDAPLGEERELYRVTIANNGERRTVEVGEPALRLTPPPTAGTRLTVVQVGTLAVSAPATLVVG